MYFKALQKKVQDKFATMQTTGRTWFRSDIDPGYLWEKYLESFPPGTNPMFRERTEHDCQCCRRFIKSAGTMVQINDKYEIETIWDIPNAGEYQPVVDTLNSVIKAHGVANIFLSSETNIGVASNVDSILGPGTIWNHFFLSLPKVLVRPGIVIATDLSKAESLKTVFLGGLEKISLDAVDTVIDLINQNSIYRGKEKASKVSGFKKILEGYLKLSNNKQRNLFAWVHSTSSSSKPFADIKNDVIGTLLLDITEGTKTLDACVNSFEQKMGASNYQMTKSVVTPKMKDLAKAKVVELGLMPSFDRVFATYGDVPVTNFLYVDRSVKPKGAGDIFDSLPVKPKAVPKYDGIAEISIDDFIQKVITQPGVIIEVLFDPSKTANLVSLIGPGNPTAEKLFKWNNLFCWSYNGNVADSIIKEKVKAAGGNVTGDVCCRLAWYNYDDLDLHMMEPGSTHIYYGNKASLKTQGRLDVDMNATGGNTKTPVENIFYASKDKMIPGGYDLYVHQFRRRENVDVGFEVEIDILGQRHHFKYENDLPNDKKVPVAKLIVSSDKSVKIEPWLPMNTSSQSSWGLTPGEFVKVTGIMFSPNYWELPGIGNQHVFFMLENCVREGDARGFMNEFLRSDLHEHRKVMDLVGCQAKALTTVEQMSGLGFSTTMRNELVVRVKGSFERLLKIKF